MASSSIQDSGAFSSTAAAVSEAINGSTAASSGPSSPISLSTMPTMSNSPVPSFETAQQSVMAVPTVQQRHDSTLRRRRTTVILRVPEVEVPERKGSKALWQQQPYFLAYSGATSLVAPVASVYQLCKLYNIQKPPAQLLRMSLAIFPHQTFLKVIQINSSTPIKEYCNPWMAFGCVGILQGAVYGQANMHFSRMLQLGGAVQNKTGFSLLSCIFRGSAFAGMRDCISQGMPFVFSSTVKEEVLDKVWNTTSREEDQDSDLACNIKHWTSILGTSVVATYLSQGMHNFQTTMQTNTSLTYKGAVESVLQKHGVRGLLRGAEARVGLLLVVNVLNELLLKPAWS